ncbi:alpha/beta hydrolase-fold protein [Achromobacter spanius]|uniref:alpha/beta hydrolase n=1 Tax=Achromobacter spanius TaxID=217203 RepID=UPI00320A3856
MSKSKSMLRFSRPAALIGALWITAAGAQPVAADAPVRPGMQLVGETVADRPSAFYRFETHRLDSADRKRHYRIQIAVPKGAVPKGGSPVLYMLDGNAALATLTDADLQRISAGVAPVLVAVGYDVPTRNDVVARAYDYTPPVYENGKPLPNPVVRGHEGGGADIFLAFIREQVKPLVRRAAAVDAEKEYLWGHSYGGLFALHVLFTQPDAFARYIAGDPSAWWNDGVLVREWRQFRHDRAAGKRVAILVGTKPREPGRPTPIPATPAANGQAVDLRAVVREMADGLQGAGADATYEAFPQFGHGDMLRASLERALDVATTP